MTPDKPTISIVAPDGVSSLKIRNEKEAGTLEFSTGLSAGFALLLGGAFLGPYYRQRRLLRWGTLAPARIVYQGKYTFRGRDYLAVRYEFEGEGSTISGERKHIDPSDWQLHARMQVKPLVLYDPTKPARNGLFPFNSAELRD